MSGLSEIFVNTDFDEGENEGLAGTGLDERGKLGGG
jgi:hypothetical protein